MREEEEDEMDGCEEAAFCSMMVCVFTCVQSDLKFSFVFIRTL